MKYHQIIWILLFVKKYKKNAKNQKNSIIIKKNNPF